MVAKLKIVNVTEAEEVTLITLLQLSLLSPWGEGMAQIDTMYLSMEEQAVVGIIILDLHQLLVDKLVR